MHSWQQIQETIDTIEEHLNENLTIDYLSTKAALSPFYFQRLFTRLVKLPLGEYIKYRRLTKSLDMLSDTEEKILDIALCVGFSSPEHYSRSFKEAYGITPMEYRKNPIACNRVNKPELILNYTMIDENVPLIVNDIVLEVTRCTLKEPIQYVGKIKEAPLQFIQDLGVQAGEDPLYSLWEEIHLMKKNQFSMNKIDGEIGVTLPSEREGYFKYFAGVHLVGSLEVEELELFNLLPGEYVVCKVEAENFESLVMDVLYKAQSFLYSSWLIQKGIQIEPIGIERYADHNEQTNSLEIWMKIKESII